MKIFTWAVLIHTLLFGLFWLTNSLFYTAVNDFLAAALKLRLDYLLIFLLITAGMAVWSILQLFQNKSGTVLWPSLALSILYIIFFYGSFMVLFNEDPVQISRLGQMVSYFRIVLDACLLLVLVWLLRPLAGRDDWQRFLPAGALVLFWLGCLLVPPKNVFNGSLPPKPALTAHRGASMLAPENTLAALDQAADLGIPTLEADIRISQDGVPFLMHDPTLRRTTNVAEVFPGREKQPAENFTMDELHKLSAGRWFVDQDPFGTIRSGLVPALSLDRYRQERIPTLAEVLSRVRESKLAFIFDLEPVPAGHPYSGKLFEIAFDMIHAAGIDSQVWFLADEVEALRIQKEAPAMKLAAGIGAAHPPAVEELGKQKYRIVNSEYTLKDEAVRAYRASGMWVNLWTVDEPWQFSRLWLLGVDSVTSNNIHALTQLQQPFFGLTFSLYGILWGVVGLLGLGILYFLFRG